MTSNLQQQKTMKLCVQRVTKEFWIGTKHSRTLFGRIFHAFSGRESKRRFVVLNEVSLSVSSGEVVGIIGGNGSGKTTLLRIIANILPVYDGRVTTVGRVIALISLMTALEDRLTLEENVRLVGSLFGMGQNEIRDRFDDIVAFAGLENFVVTKVYQFSSGMRQRLAFAVAVHARPDVLLLDEIFAVGDEVFRQKSVQKVRELADAGTAVVVVSHELWILERYCDRVIRMEHGAITAEGAPSTVLDQYRSFS